MIDEFSARNARENIVSVKGGHNITLLNYLPQCSLLSLCQQYPQCCQMNGVVCSILCHFVCSPFFVSFFSFAFVWLALVGSWRDNWLSFFVN
jgi:hypothetical protein